MVNVWIDEFTPCLKDAITGDLIETEVVAVARKSVLSKYNKKTQWYTNWSDLLEKGHEIYAIVIKGTSDIQGLVALASKADYQAVYIAWMCAAPHNNRELTDTPKYIGVGGHLFSIAIDKSIEYGYDGVVTGFAMDEYLLKHYQKSFNALYLGALHPYHFMIDEENARRIREVYTYDWTDAKL